MFDIGWSEIALIGVVAVVAIGPKEMPQVMRQAARWMRAARKVMREFQNQIDEVIHAEEIKDIKRQLADSGIDDFDAQVRRELENSAEQLRQATAVAPLDAPAGDKKS